MTNVVQFPRQPVPPIRAIEEDELRAAAALFQFYSVEDCDSFGNPIRKQPEEPNHG